MLDLFREEARGQTATLGRGLLDLERDPTDPQKIEPLMRAAHSLKGAARIVGFDGAVGLAHGMEEVLVAAQHGRIRLTPVDDIDTAVYKATDLPSPALGEPRVTRKSPNVGRR